MTTNIPKSVKVGAVTYTVEIVPNLFESDSLYGQVTYPTHHIRIAGDISAERQQMTFIHELTHAMLFECGRVREYVNEGFVRQVGAILAMVVADNGWVISA